LEGLVGMSRNPSPQFWRNKKVLLTGHTGFKGAWLSIWLHRLGAHVIGISLPALSEPNLFDLAGVNSFVESHMVDIRREDSLESIFTESKPEIVFHLAAQALVRPGYRDPLLTFGTNIQGTANVLEAIRKTDSVKAAVMVTTDKVYKNLEHLYPYRETDVLGGYDPYSASKAASELIIDCYKQSFFADRGLPLGIARAGNVIGGGDWSEDRLIPDAIRAWSGNDKLIIRSPESTRPWQHVLEPLCGYLKLVEAIFNDSSLEGAYNFGPHTSEAASVKKVIKLARDIYGTGEVVWGNSIDSPHEAGWLSLEVSKALFGLGVEPRLSLEDSVRLTIDWYKSNRDGVDAADLCAGDILKFESI
jgi:CDP-glucose 4,6-dehydratase